MHFPPRLTRLNRLFFAVSVFTASAGIDRRPTKYGTVRMCAISAVDQATRYHSVDHGYRENCHDNV
jgi:hypothetical protein